MTDGEVRLWLLGLLLWEGSFGQPCHQRYATKEDGFDESMFLSTVATFNCAWMMPLESVHLCVCVRIPLCACVCSRAVCMCVLLCFAAARLKFHEDGVPNFNGRCAQILNFSCPAVKGSSWETRNVVIGVPNDAGAVLLLLV